MKPLADLKDDVTLITGLDRTFKNGQDVHAQGRAAALTLLKILDRSPDTAKRVILPTELVIRQSTLGGGAGWA